MRNGSLNILFNDFIKFVCIHCGLNPSLPLFMNLSIKLIYFCENAQLALNI